MRRSKRWLGFALALVSGATACSLLVDSEGLASRSDATAFDGGSDVIAVEAASEDAALDDEGAASDAAPDVADDTCPGTAGPTPVRVGDAGFCIDSTEVTVAHYRAFLEARAGDTSGQPDACHWNTSFVPTYGMPNAQRDPTPITWVDWCDAVAYCTWAGKRLCGAMGSGAAIAATEGNDPSRSEWHYACSRNNDGLHQWPYGNDYEAHRCVGLDWFDGGSERAEPVDASPRCEGAFPGIFNLSGNAREWENACESPDAGTDAGMVRCRNRGGSFYDNDLTMRCQNVSLLERSASNTGVGIRCCSR